MKKNRSRKSRDTVPLSGTFLFIPKILEQNQKFRFVPTSFLQKQNVSIFSKTFGTKPKLFDVFQLF
jgi:hypothetical protein